MKFWMEKCKAIGAGRILPIGASLVYQKIRILFYLFLSDNKDVLSSGKLRQASLFVGKGKIRIGKSSLGVWQSPYFLSTYCYIEARSQTAKVIIGDGVFINNNASIIADKTTIEIENNCLIGPNFSVYDSDFHEINPLTRNSGNQICNPVRIQENVFIGGNVTVLKGVTIGKNSVIASGAIVTKDIPENSIAAGNPARVIKKIET